MILSRGRRYLFVHIPKTGGTSLALALEGRAMADDMMLGDTPKARKRRRRLNDVSTRGRLWKHSMRSDLEGLIAEDEMNSLFAFTLVRNPWDRMVSYYHWLQTQTFVHAAVTLAQQLDFAAFLRHPLIQTALRENPAPRYMTGSDGVERCDLYIRVEYFAQDAQPLFEHLGFELSLPHSNQSARLRDWRGYYTDETVEIVRQISAVEITRFEYSFNDLPLTQS
ncbi:sulfotransferase family protein [Epibacterium ulvae]|uniref:sulfotransferase family 2 domain-containing protein n=1 Tax=Epibacterium ulvae TaxID=1156985 RepID=UPI001BFC2BBB|nr:sulfotransferase family 2 domain-containing protein [Epibacterium ulvae]MBT8152893.1 sulfotransferase family protein [Epibacterium ulvae]